MFKKIITIEIGKENFTIQNYEDDRAFELSSIHLVRPQGATSLANTFAGFDLAVNEQLKHYHIRINIRDLLVRPAFHEFIMNARFKTHKHIKMNFEYTNRERGVIYLENASVHVIKDVISNGLVISSEMRSVIFVHENLL